MSRGCYEDAARKLIRWNLAYFNYLDKINKPKQQSLQQLFGLKDYEALKPPFRRIFQCTPTATSVVRHWQRCHNLGADVALVLRSVVALAVGVMT